MGNGGSEWIGWGRSVVGKWVSGLRTLIGEPDVAVGREGEIVDHGEFVAEVIVEDGGDLAGAGVEGVNAWREDSIHGGTSTGVYQAIVKRGADAKVEGRSRCSLRQCWGVHIQVYDVLPWGVGLRGREKEEIQVWLMNGTFAPDGGDRENEFDLRVCAQHVEPTSLVPDKEAGVGDAGKGRITWHVCLRTIVIEAVGIEDVSGEALRHQAAVSIHAIHMWESVAGKRQGKLSRHKWYLSLYNDEKRDSQSKGR